MVGEEGLTCIAGLVANGKVYIGGDSAGVTGWSLTVRADQKVFRNGPFLIGFTTSFRMGQLLRYSFSPPVRVFGQDLYAYMVTDFINGVRECLKGGGFAERDKDVEKGGNFLVGYAGRLFAIESDYQVGEESSGLSACGTGSDTALGALYATATLPPLDRIRIALEAAERFSAGVRGPFHIEEI